MGGLGGGKPPTLKNVSERTNVLNLLIYIKLLLDFSISLNDAIFIFICRYIIYVIGVLSHFV